MIIDVFLKYHPDKIEPKDHHLDNYFQQYEFINPWIFNLLNNLETSIKNQIVDRYFNKTVDTSDHVLVNSSQIQKDVLQK